MLLERFFLIVVVGLSASARLNVHAFAVCRPVPSRTISASTCLRSQAEEAEGEQEDVPMDNKQSEAPADILNSPAFLTRKLEVLKSDLQKAEEDLQAANERLEAGKAEWGPQLEDLQKEYKNIQERMTAQSKEGDSMATVQVARKMLEVLDNYDRAFGAVTPETDEQRAIEAEYKQTYQMIFDVFEKLGVEEVETVGTEFDYEVHQAVMQKPSEYDEGIVCEEMQKGFKIGDTLVRAAMVVVSA